MKKETETPFKASEQNLGSTGKGSVGLSRFQLPPTEPDVRLSPHPALRRSRFSPQTTQELTHPGPGSPSFGLIWLRLYPFPLWLAFPTSEYYGYSVTMSLSAFR
jgi:hypothetical protein